MINDIGNTIIVHQELRHSSWFNFLVMAHLDKARLSHGAAVEGCVFVNLKISYLFRDAIVHHSRMRQLQFM